MTTGFSEVRRGSYLLAQDMVAILKQTNAASGTVTEVKKGELIQVLRSANVDNVQWLRVSDSKGQEGYITSDTLLEPAPIRRFNKERVAFIACLSAVAGIFNALVDFGQGGPQSLVGRFFVGVLLLAVGVTGCLIALQIMVDKELFFDTVVPDTPEQFSWEKFAREPFRVLGLVVLLLIIVFLIAVGRALIQYLR